MTTYATEFKTIFGTAIQGMVITWGNTYLDAQAGAAAADTVLTMDFQLNFGNVIDLATSTGAGCADATNDSNLAFYLTFLNYDSDTINDLYYDAFVGMIQFHKVAGTSPALDTLQWITNLETSTITGVDVGFENDWTADSGGVLVAPDATTNDYTIADSSAAAWQDCDYYITLNINNVQCGQITTSYSVKFKKTDTAAFEDIDIAYRKIAISGGWNLLTATTDISVSADTIKATNYFSSAKPTSSLFSEQIVDFGAFMEAEPEPTIFGRSHLFGSVLATTTAALLLF